MQVVPANDLQTVLGSAGQSGAAGTAGDGTAASGSGQPATSGDASGTPAAGGSNPLQSLSSATAPELASLVAALPSNDQTAVYNALPSADQQQVQQALQGTQNPTAQQIASAFSGLPQGDLLNALSGVPPADIQTVLGGTNSNPAANSASQSGASKGDSQPSKSGASSGSGGDKGGGGMSGLEKTAIIGGVGVAGVVGYKKVVKPWLAERTAGSGGADGAAASDGPIARLRNRLPGGSRLQRVGETTPPAEAGPAPGPAATSDSAARPAAGDVSVATGAGSEASTGDFISALFLLRTLAKFNRWKPVRKSETWPMRKRVSDIQTG